MILPSPPALPGSSVGLPPLALSSLPWQEDELEDRPSEVEVAASAVANLAEAAPSAAAARSQEVAPSSAPSLSTDPSSSRSLGVAQDVLVPQSAEVLSSAP